MKIYNYDSITFEYTGSQNADLNPEETKRQGKNVYLLPAFATTIKPPTAQIDKARVWQENQWGYIADYRQNYYKVDTELHINEIDKLGEIEEGYILITKELGELIKENPDNYIIDNGIVREKTEEEKEAEERERISKLSLTKREVFLALYKDKGITPEQIKAQITNPEALIEFEYAGDYYRGNPLIDAIGSMLGYTSAQLDYLFEYKELPEVNND